LFRAAEVMVVSQSHIVLILDPHVLHVDELFQVARHFLQLKICLVVVKWDYWYTVFGLETIAVRGLYY
jgi:hypothetical protein